MSALTLKVGRSYRDGRGNVHVIRKMQKDCPTPFIFECRGGHWYDKNGRSCIAELSKDASLVEEV